MELKGLDLQIFDYSIVTVLWVQGSWFETCFIDKDLRWSAAEMEYSWDDSKYRSYIAVKRSFWEINHCVKSVRIRIYSSPYSVRMRENTVQKNPNMDTSHAVNYTPEKRL